jgi:hypothetical protein
MTPILYSLIAGLIVLGLLLLFLALFIKQKLIQQQQLISSLSEQLDLHHKQINTVTEGMNEVRVGGFGMGAKLKEVSASLEKLELQQEDIINMDPDHRVYSTAAKLVSTGASVEDLMRECDLPRGEAELLISLHNK